MINRNGRHIYNLGRFLPIIFLVVFIKSSLAGEMTFLGAQNLLFENRLEEAAEAFEELLDKEPGQQRIQDSLVRCYMKLADAEAKSGNTKKELHWYSKAIETAPDELSAHLKTIEIHKSAGKVDKVIAAARKSLEAGSREKHLVARVYENLAWAYLEKDDLDNAITAVENARKTDYSAVRYLEEVESRKAVISEEMELQGDAASNRGDMTAAEEYYKKALGYAPPSDRKNIHEKLRDISKQLEEVKKKQLVRERMKEYRSLTQEGRWEEALEIVQQVMEMQPSEELKRMLARAKSEVKRINDERASQSEAQRKNERMDMLLRALQNSVASRDWNKGRMLIDNLKSMNCPESAYAEMAAEIAENAAVLDMKIRAERSFELGEFLESARLYDEYLKNYPDEKELLSIAAKAYMEGGNSERALELYRLAMSNGTANTSDIKNTVKILNDQGNLLDAIPLLEKLRLENPGDLETGWWLFKLYSETDRFDPARSVLEGMIPHMTEEFASVNHFYEMLGNMYAQAGLHRRAFEQYINNVSVAENQGQAQWKVAISFFHFIGVYILYFLVNVTAVGYYIRWYFRGV